MANPDPIPQLKRPQVAALLGVNESTVTKWEREGLPIAALGGRGTATLYDAPAIVAWFVRRRVAEVVGDGPGALNTEQQRARRDAAQANLAEQQHAVRAGTLIPRADFQRVLGKVVMEIRAKLLAAPRAWAVAVVKAAVHGPAAVEALLTARVRDVLEALATVEVDTAS